MRPFIDMILGIVFVIISSLIYGVEPSIRALAFETGVTPVASMELSCFVFLVLCAMVCLLRRINLRIPWRDQLQLFLIGGLGLGTTSILLASSYQYIPVGFATVIHFMYPTLVCVAMAVLFHNRLTLPKLLAMACSIIGLTCICGDSIYGSITGIVLALCSSMTYVFYLIMTEKSRTASLPLEIRLFYIALGCLAAALLCGIFDRSGHVWSGREVLYITGCGVMTFIAGYCFAAGIYRIGASSAAFFSLFEPITSLVFSTLLYHYAFTERTIIGCIISLVAIVLVCIGNAREAKLEQCVC